MPLSGAEQCRQHQRKTNDAAFRVCDF
jgi:hypothetical protein